MPINNVTAHNSPQEERRGEGRAGEEGEGEGRGVGHGEAAAVAAIRRGAADGSGDWN